MPNVKISLCAEEDDYVLATKLTDTQGYYEFKGVPVGDFYLKVEFEGYSQISTYNIEVVKDSHLFDNKNFIINNGEVVTGIEEIESGIRIYPNPASNSVNISATEEIKALQIRDINGRTIMNKKGSNSTYVNLPIEKLIPGLYIFEITTNSTISNKKIIIKN